MVASQPAAPSPGSGGSFWRRACSAVRTAALRAHLRAYPPGPDGLLFTTPAGNVLNPANWRQRIWRRGRRT